VCLKDWTFLLFKHRKPPLPGEQTEISTNGMQLAEGGYESTTTYTVPITYGKNEDSHNIRLDRQWTRSIENIHLPGQLEFPDKR
jgi:hypothetical protein